MTESRRSDYRRNAFRFGTLRFGESRETPGELQCLVWDQSETGAMVEVETPDAVPERVILVVDGNDAPRACTVSRRDGLRIGLRFEE